MGPIWLMIAEAAPLGEAGKETGGVVQFILDHPFALGLTFLFLVAIVSAFVAARKRDRCLKKFRRYPVTIREQAGRRIWGGLKVFSKGMELIYEWPHDRPAKNSFLIYEPELGRLLTVSRFVDRLGERDLRRRRRQNRKLIHPPVHSRVWRWVRNIVNTFRDAIVQALGMTVQQAARTAPGPALAAQTGQISAVGALLIGETANAYEPIIEQYIGKPVILELVNPADPQKRIVEYHGYLGEYSPQFVLLADVAARFEETAPLDGGTSTFLEGTLAVRAQGRAIHVENRSGAAVTVEGVRAGERFHEVRETVEPGRTADVGLPEGAEAAGAVAALSYRRRFEMIVPRACGVIRHASEPPGAAEGGA